MKRKTMKRKNLAKLLPKMSEKQMGWAWVFLNQRLGNKDVIGAYYDNTDINAVRRNLILADALECRNGVIDHFMPYATDKMDESTFYEEFIALRDMLVAYCKEESSNDEGRHRSNTAKAKRKGTSGSHSPGNKSAK